MAHTCKIETGDVRLTERRLVYEPRTWLAEEMRKYFPQKFAAADANLTKDSWQTGDGGRVVCTVGFL